MPLGLFRVLWNQLLELALGGLVIEEGGPGPAKHPCEFRPGVGRTHVDDPNRLDPRLGRLDAKEVRGLAGLDAVPELFLGGQQQVLVERVGRNGHLHPLAAAGNDRQHRGSRSRNPHVVL